MDLKKAIRRAVIDEIRRGEPVSHGLSSGCLDDYYEDRDYCRSGAFKMSEKGRMLDLSGMSPEERVRHVTSKILTSYSGDSVLGNYKSAFIKLGSLYDDRKSAKKNFKIMNAAYKMFKDKKDDDYHDYSSILKMLESGSDLVLAKSKLSSPLPKYGSSKKEFSKKRSAAEKEIIKAEKKLAKTLQRRTKPRVILFKLNKRYDSTDEAVQDSIDLSLKSPLNKGFSEDEIIDAVHERYIGKPSLSAEGEKEYKVDDNDNFIFKKVYQTRINKANNLNAPKN
jgi:hypothetical protein